MGSGTLTKALELLRPHVPPNLIPENLPISELWQIKQWAGVPTVDLTGKIQDKK
jgi:hypothetical protein